MEIRSQGIRNTTISEPGDVPPHYVYVECPDCKVLRSRVREVETELKLVASWRDAALALAGRLVDAVNMLEDVDHWEIDGRATEAARRAWEAILQARNDWEKRRV